MDKNIRPITLKGVIGNDLEIPGDGCVFINDGYYWYMLPPLHRHFNSPCLQEVPMDVAGNIIVALGVFCTC
eukprot:3115901-Ditylum_brightwellii.AAC.1